MHCAKAGSISGVLHILLAVPLWACFSARPARAQVPPDIEAGIKKIGQVVDPACTAKLYRPSMPAKDYNVYWPVGASAPVDREPLYPGIAIVRDQNFGPNPKDLADIFYTDKGKNHRTVLMYIPGGAGNKIEQQDREANAFYDNIGRWAAKNGMVAVTVQRHPGSGNWDDGGRDISKAVDWVQANIAKYHGNPNRIFIWAQSAGNGPAGIYIGHADRWAHGVVVKGAILMSGNPVPAVGAGARGLAAGGRNPLAFTSTCGAGGPGAVDGAISGPSRATAPTQGAPGAARGAGQEPSAEEVAERDNLPGFEKTKVKLLLARAEWDPGVTGDMAASDKTLHDNLCKLDGPNAKDGAGHCPVMLFMKGESHMSAVFSIDTSDQTVSGPVLKFIRSVK